MRGSERCWVDGGDRYLASIAIIRFVDSSVIATRCDPPLRLPYACARITYLKSPYTLKLRYPFLSASTKRKNDHRYIARYERSLLRHHLSKPLSRGPFSLSTLLPHRGAIFVTLTS